MYNCGGAQSAQPPLDPDRPFWLSDKGNRKFTDQRTFIEILIDIYYTWFEERVIQNFAMLRVLCCAGVSIDDTYKIAGRLRVMQHDENRKRRFVEAAPMLQTMMSSLTCQVVDLHWLPDKTSATKELALTSLFQLHATLPGRAQCKYVATDNAAQDVGFIKRCAQQFLRDSPHQQGLQMLPEAGDDFWHARRRITSEIHGDSNQAALEQLKQVYQEARQPSGSLVHFKTELLNWMGRHNDVPSMRKAVHAAAVQHQKAEYLFAWQKVYEVSRAGTNANERWHRHLEKVCGHTAFVRPDHLKPLLALRAYTFNTKAKDVVRQMHWYTNVAFDIERDAWESLFCELDHIDFLKSMQPNKFFMHASPTIREFTMEDFRNPQLNHPAALLCGLPFDCSSKARMF